MTLRLGGRAAESLAFDEVSTVQPTIWRKRLRSPTAWFGSVFDPLRSARSLTSPMTDTRGTMARRPRQ